MTPLTLFFGLALSLRPVHGCNPDWDASCLERGEGGCTMGWDASCRHDDFDRREHHERRRKDAPRRQPSTKATWEIV